MDRPQEFLADKELYVLRNQSRSRGISFFEEGGFYPDFILWLMIDDQQYITFVDPHGLFIPESLATPRSSSPERSSRFRRNGSATPKFN